EVIYFVIFLFAIAIIGPMMIQKFWRCQPLEFGYHRTRIEKLCEKAGLQYANILYWPIFGGKMITAGVMGLVKKFRYILVTNALLKLLEPVEIDAVIAHEIGHVKKKHLLFYLFFLAGYLLLSYAIFDLIIYFILYVEPIYRFLSNAGIQQTSVTSALFSLIIILIFFIYFRYIFGYFMRNFERQADSYVYSVFDTAVPLITTLEKIAATSGLPDDKPNWHHFSIRDRIDYLKKCEIDRKWIKRQDRKIRKSMLVYLLGILLIGGLGYNLNFGETGKKLNHQFFITLIQREIEKSPDSPKLFSILGDLWYSRLNYEKTIRAYKKALSLLPDSPQVLNNLAWLYATCEDQRYRDPKQAIALARRAAALDRSPHVLDTLAESYYVNGRFEEAVSASKQALNMAKNNRGYYEKQLRKFIEGSK
ncbi:MAG: M48 family metalloprotease, partial [Desulfobacterales bacterium]